MSFAPRSLAIAATLPGWMEALRHRAGPLLAAADDLQRWLGPNPFPEGRDGVRRLGELVDAFVFDPALEEAPEERFVETVGAMLGLLLIAHVGVGRHLEREGRHRIGIGTHGFFDPFGAVDAALDAPSPSRELAKRIAAAESEALGEGPCARVQLALDAALERLGGRRTIRDRFELHATLDDGTELQLERFASLGDEPGPLAAALDRLVRALERPDAPALVWDDIAERLVPRLVPRRFVDELRTNRGVAIAYEAITDELGVALVLAFDGRLRFLREDEERALAEAGHDPRATSLARLEALASTTRWKAETLAGVACATGTRADGLAASAVLAPSVREALGARLGADFVVAFPHRDRLIATHAEGALPSLAAFVADEFHRAPHGVSPALFRVRGQDLVRLP